MDNENDHADFVAGVTRILSEHPNTGILVIVDDPNGIMSLCNSHHSVVTLGLLRKATLALEQAFVPRGDIQVKSGESKDMAEQITGHKEGWKN